MAPHYGLIIAVGTMVLVVFGVALSIILICPGQLEDRQNIDIRTSAGLPPRRRRFKGYRRRHHSELTPLLEDHDQAAAIPFATRPDLGNQLMMDEDADMAALNNQLPSTTKTAEANIKRFQAIRSPLPRPEDDHMLDRISEEGSMPGQPEHKGSPGSRSSTHLTEQQHTQGSKRLESHRKLNDALEESAAAAKAQHDSSSSSSGSSSSSSSSNSSHAARKGREAHNDRLAGHSIGARECHCAFCLARLQAA